MNVLSLSILPLVIALNLPVALNPAALAQQNGLGAAGPDTANDQNEAIFDLDFDGGTVADYVNAINRAARGANIVLMPVAQRVGMPPVQLRSVNLPSALDVLDGLQQVTADSICELRVGQSGPMGRAAKAIFTVNGETAQRGRTSPKGRRTMVLAVAEVLEEGVAAEDLLTAIETTLDLLADEYDPAEVRFHESTGLVIARGDADQMQAIENVVDQVAENVHRQRSRRQKQAGMEEVQQEREELRTELERSEQLSGNLRIELAEARQVFVNERDQAQHLMQQVRERDLRMAEMAIEIQRLQAALARSEGKGNN